MVHVLECIKAHNVVASAHEPLKRKRKEVMAIEKAKEKNQDDQQKDMIL